jgi:hypothetical protein
MTQIRVTARKSGGPPCLIGDAILELDLSRA